MKPNDPPDAWNAGEAYEQYVGRWSRRVAERFLERLPVPPGAGWADVGCGTGALTAVILSQCGPREVAGIDASAKFVEQARRRLVDGRVRLQVGDATRLPWADASFDAAVSGLVLNFVPDPVAMVREMARTTRPAGSVALYVWDYAKGMEMMRVFWDAAVATQPDAARFDEAKRFPICDPEALRTLFTEAGLVQVSSDGIDIETRFADFDDYWTPFLGATGPAPSYLGSLDAVSQEQIRTRVKASLPVRRDGSIPLRARAWMVSGTVA